MAVRLTSSAKLRLTGAGRIMLTEAAALSGNAATAVTLADITQNMTVFQRVGTSKSITISGTYTGSPDAIQARVVDASTGAAMVDWATIAAAPTGGVFAGAIAVPQGAWYKLQVRDSVNTAITAAGTNKFGVGMVVGMIGQSNMVALGNAYSVFPLSDPRVVEFKPSAYHRIGQINDAYPPSTVSGGYPDFTSDGTRADGITFIGNLIAKHIGIPVAFIERAIGGTRLDEYWLTGQAGWTAFAAAVTAAGGDMEMCLWYQGESSAHYRSTAQMVSELGALQSQLHTLTGRTSANFKFGVMSLGPGSYDSSLEGEFGNMRSAQVQFATGTAGAFLLGAVHDTSTGGDVVHLTSAEISRISKRVAKTVLFQCGYGTSGAGPRITGASRSGTSVTINIAHSGGTALTDGAGGAGGSLSGFEFKDAGAGGAAIAYSGATISGNTVALTLASAPVGALSMSYAMMNVPHGTLSAVVAASVVYDNAIYDTGLTNSTIGCPLQPVAAFNVS